MCSILLGKAILHNVQQNPESAVLYKKKKRKKKKEEGYVCVWRGDAPPKMCSSSFEH